MDRYKEGKEDNYEEIFYSDDEITTLCNEAEKSGLCSTTNTQDIWTVPREHGRSFNPLLQVHTGENDPSYNSMQVIRNHRKTPGGEMKDNNQIALFKPILETMKLKVSTESNCPDLNAGTVPRTKPINIPLNSNKNREDRNIYPPDQQVIKEIQDMRDLIHDMRDDNTRYSKHRDDNDKLVKKIKSLREENTNLTRKTLELYERHNKAQNEIKEQAKVIMDQDLNIEKRKQEIYWLDKELVNQQEEIDFLRNEIKRLYREYVD